MLNADPGIWQSGQAAEDRPVRVVIYGEISSGKSTVLNVLLRDVLVPNFMGKTWRPSIVVQHDRNDGLYVRHIDDRIDPVKSLAEDGQAESVLQCIVQTSAPHLAGIEIIELPAAHDGEIADEVFSFIASADILIWTTIASQAWRLTEKTVLDRLGDRRPKHAILAVTRADKLRSSADAARIRGRVEVETRAYFDDIVFINGAPDLIRDAHTSDEAWRHTSGADLCGLLRVHADEILSARNGAAYLLSEAEAEPIRSDDPLPRPLRHLAESRAEVVDFSSYRKGMKAPESEAPNMAADMAAHIATEAEAPAAEAPPAEQPAEQPTGQPAAEPEVQPDLQPLAEVAEAPAEMAAAAAPEAAPAPAAEPTAPAKAEAETAQPVTHAAFEVLRKKIGDMRGIRAAGVAPIAGTAGAMTLTGKPDDIDSMAEFCRASLARQNASAGRDERMETLCLIGKEQTMLMHVVEPANAVLFALCMNAEINTAAARSAMTQLGSALQEAL